MTATESISEPVVTRQLLRDRRTIVRRRIVGLLVLGAMIVGTDRLGAYVLQRVILSSKSKFSLLMSGKIDADIVALGNSRGINSFHAPSISKLTGKKAFNLAYNGSGTYSNYLMFKEFLNRCEHKPSVVMIEITGLSKEPLPGKFRQYWGCSKLWASAANEFDHKEYVAAEIFNLYRFNSGLFLRSLYYLNKTDQDHVNRYMIHKSLVQGEIDNADVPVKLPVPNDENTYAVKEMVRLCRENGITPHLYIAPYLPQYRARFVDFDEWKAQVQSAVGDDVRIWDFSVSLSQLEYFADRLHTNNNATDAINKLYMESGILTADDMVVAKDESNASEFESSLATVDDDQAIE